MPAGPVGGDGLGNRPVRHPHRHALRYLFKNIASLPPFAYFSKPGLSSGKVVTTWDRGGAESSQLDALPYSGGGPYLPPRNFPPPYPTSERARVAEVAGLGAGFPERLPKSQHICMLLAQRK